MLRLAKMSLRADVEIETEEQFNFYSDELEKLIKAQAPETLHKTTKIRIDTKEGSLEVIIEFLSNLDGYAALIAASTPIAAIAGYKTFKESAAVLLEDIGKLGKAIPELFSKRTKIDAKRLSMKVSEDDYQRLLKLDELVSEIKSAHDAEPNNSDMIVKKYENSLEALLAKIGQKEDHEIFFQHARKIIPFWPDHTFADLRSRLREAKDKEIDGLKQKLGSTRVLNYVPGSIDVIESRAGDIAFSRRRAKYRRKSEFTIEPTNPK